MLQAYALQEKLKELFPECVVEIINIEFPKILLRDLLFCFRKNYRQVGANFKRFQRFLCLRNFKKNSFTLSSPKLLSSVYEKAVKYINEQGYFLIVVGSDEVWKVGSTSDLARGFPNIYWLGDMVKGTKVAYAASAHKTIYNELPVSKKTIINNSLRDFNLVSVRDDITFGLAREAVGESESKKVAKVLDPTFLFDFNKCSRSVEEIFKSEKISLPDGRYVLFVIEDEIISKIVSDYFRDRGMTIISTGYINRYSDHNFVGHTNPFDWQKLFSKAAFCLTDRFHGTIFSIKNRIPFLAVGKDKANYKCKISLLLEDFELSRYFFDTSQTSCDSLGTKIEAILSEGEYDISRVEQDRIKKSIDYLLRCRSFCYDNKK